MSFAGEQWGGGGCMRVALEATHRDRRRDATPPGTGPAATSVVNEHAAATGDSGVLLVQWPPRTQATSVSPTQLNWLERKVRGLWLLYTRLFLNFFNNLILNDITKSQPVVKFISVFSTQHR